jgi:DNA primase
MLTADRTSVLAAIDLETLFAELVGPQGRSRQSPCPAHDGQTGDTPPVVISRKPEGHQVWFCHACGAGGTAVDLLQVVYGIDVAEAFGRLRARTGISAPPPQRPYLPPPTPRPRPVAELPPPNAGRIEGPEGEELLARYIAARGWSADVVEPFGLYAVGRQGRKVIRHPHRENGAIKQWDDRVLDGGHPKWLAPKDIPRRPYAIDLAAILEWTRETPSIFVVEGAADVIAMAHVANGAACIGIPGTERVDRWVRMLSGLDVFLMTDADRAGDKAAHELAQLLPGHTARIRPPDGLDVNDWLRHQGAASVRRQIVEQADAAGDWGTWTAAALVA